MIKKILKISIVLSIIGFTNMLNVKAQITEPLRNLEGNWQFSVGDDMQWAGVNFNDEDWDRIYAPANWESQGYDGYNGYAWYRKTIRLANINPDRSIVLYLGEIDDADQVFINGKLIGKTGDFFPNFIAKPNQQRIYPIPKGLLKQNEENIIAVRVYDIVANGGIVNGPLGLYYDLTKEILEIDLAGNWRFAKSDNINPKLSELNWTDIKVPAHWEDEGFEDYNGYGIYLKSFNIPAELASQELVLVLGKIDDYDYVYFNGKLIGKVFDLKSKGAYSGRGNEYRALRAYTIPDKLIKKGEKNTVVVKVYDYYLDGGIYEGPVGIVTQENFNKIARKYYNNNPTLWDLIFD